MERSGMNPGPVNTVSSMRCRNRGGADTHWKDQVLPKTLDNLPYFLDNLRTSKVDLPEFDNVTLKFRMQPYTICPFTSSKLT